MKKEPKLGALSALNLADEDYDVVEPRADAMIQSLRSVGYDLATAIADLIDNSIAAGAKNVWLNFFWDGEDSHITIADDGRGMSKAELLDAMRAGSRSPLEKRDPKDLGRFGLGLKTASFSQAKRLTVGSKLRGEVSVRCWDLDAVTARSAWHLLKRGSERFSKYGLETVASVSSGTVVMWEEMDRVVPAGAQTDSQHAQDLFLAKIEQVRDHVAMVFHRFLDSTPGRSIKIYINGNLIKAWDPFLTNEKATDLLTEEAVSLFGDRLTIRPYILPHYTKISQESHKRASGVKGWTAHQGFYVYRNKRLLVAGSWLGLGFQQEDHYKLARILVDIPNHMDAEWEIDVKKSRAWPPPAIRDDLKRLAVATRNRAVEVYRHRGARLLQGGRETTFLWERKVRRSKIFYEINRQHPVVQSALSAGGQQASRVRTLLHLIEETVPVPTITHDAVENPTKQALAFEEAAPAELKRALDSAYSMLRESGLSQADAKIMLLNVEPFNQFREMVGALDEPVNG